MNESSIGLNIGFKKSSNPYIKWSGLVAAATEGKM